MFHIIKKAIYLLCIVCSIINGHGLGSNTLINVANNSQEPIYTICRHALRDAISVASYDINNPCVTNQRVKIGKKSETNCYIQLGFDSQFNITHDIICTPTQEFYTPTTNMWVPAYQLRTGDVLLAKNGVTRSITCKKFVPESITIYMIEIETSHTFFIGKHSILTHNMFLPIAINLGFIVPFGTVATGAAGSFFGPIGLIGGAILGGIIGVTIKAFYKKRIPTYDSPTFNISFIQNNCNRINREHDSIPAGCFTAQESINTSCSYPIENPLPQITTGCIEIEINTQNSSNASEYSMYHDQEKVHNNGCFQPIEQDQQLLFDSQEQGISSNDQKPRYNGPTARNWKEFEQNCPIG